MMNNVRSPIFTYAGTKATILVCFGYFSISYIKGFSSGVEVISPHSFNAILLTVHVWHVFKYYLSSWLVLHLCASTPRPSPPLNHWATGFFTDTCTPGLVLYNLKGKIKCNLCCLTFTPPLSVSRVCQHQNTPLSHSGSGTSVHWALLHFWTLTCTL